MERNALVLDLTYDIQYQYFVGNYTYESIVLEHNMYEGCSEINETLAISKLFKKLQFSFLIDM